MVIQTALSTTVDAPRSAFKKEPQAFDCQNKMFFRASMQDATVSKIEDSYELVPRPVCMPFSTCST